MATHHRSFQRFGEALAGLFRGLGVDARVRCPASAVGNLWHVSAVHRDGSLTVHRAAGVGGSSTRLAAAYVQQHVELGSATTAHRA
jgi:hypothetical protein